MLSPIDKCPREVHNQATLIIIRNASEVTFIRSREVGRRDLFLFDTDQSVGTFLSGPKAAPSKRNLTMDAPNKKATGVPRPIATPSKSSAEPAERLDNRSSPEIAALAYRYWQARGCPNDSPEVDWLRAEHELACRP